MAVNTSCTASKERIHVRDHARGARKVTYQQGLRSGAGTLLEQLF